MPPGISYRRRARETVGMHDSASRRMSFWRCSVVGAALAAGLPLAACTTGPSGEMATIEAAQGSSENIESLTSVINRNPTDAEGYNVRGSAYGRAGRYREAL